MPEYIPMLSVSASAAQLAFDRRRELEQESKKLEERQAVIKKEWNKAEAEIRRHDLESPDSVEIFEQSLMWMREQGKEVDLDRILQKKSDSALFSSERTTKLFERAVWGIVNRTYDPTGDLGEAFGLTPEELANCLINTDTPPASELARKNVKQLQEIKWFWEDQFQQPEALKTWFRSPIPLFKGQTPLEKCCVGRANEVVHLLTLLKEGVPL